MRTHRSELGLEGGLDQPAQNATDPLLALLNLPCRDVFCHLFDVLLWVLHKILVRNPKLLFRHRNFASLMWLSALCEALSDQPFELLDAGPVRCPFLALADLHLLKL